MVSEDRREEDDDGAPCVVGEGDGGVAPFSLSLNSTISPTTISPQSTSPPTR